MRTNLLSILTLMIAGCLSGFAEQEPAAAPVDEAPVILHESRRLHPDSELGKAYHAASRSVEAAERFIREHSDERDLCAGALLGMARLQSREDKNQAIKTYRRALENYGAELVPDVNVRCTVANWALLAIGRLERDIGNRAEALEIFGKLMTSSDSNTRNSSRGEYLSLKQSHLKVVAEVAVRRKGPYSPGETIPVTVTVRNPSDEAVTFKCYSSLSGSLAPRSGCEETTLAAGEQREFPMEFTEKSTKWIEPGSYELTSRFTGITFDTNSVKVEVKK